MAVQHSTTPARGLWSLSARASGRIDVVASPSMVVNLEERNEVDTREQDVSKMVAWDVREVYLVAEVGPDRVARVAVTPYQVMR